MNFVRFRLPVVIALLFGWATLFGLLLFPTAGNRLLEWGAFIAAVALVLGVLNLMLVHLRRAAKNKYSIILLGSMLIVFGLAALDGLGLTEGGVAAVFKYLLTPLEAALASLLAFFLLFAGVRLLRRQRTIWSALFLVSAIILLLSQSPLPGPIGSVLVPIRNLINELFVSAGVRGVLIGIALGTITLSLRLLAGLEQPYSK
jgi:hypothetical protein